MRTPLSLASPLPAPCYPLLVEKGSAFIILLSSLAKQQILIKYNSRVEIDEKVARFGASKTEIEDAEITKKVNHIILTAKVAIFHCA